MVIITAIMRKHSTPARIRSGRLAYKGFRNRMYFWLLNKSSVAIKTSKLSINTLFAYTKCEVK